VPVDESKVILKGRLGPGMMITVDLLGGQVCTAVFSYFTWSAPELVIFSSGVCLFLHY